MRGRTVQVKCEACKTTFSARVADRNRGWGRFCSKRCKAVEQEGRTGQHAKNQQKVVSLTGRDERNWLGSGVDRETYEYYQQQYGGRPQFNHKGEYQGFVMSREELAYGGYGDADWDTEFGEGKW